ETLQHDVALKMLFRDSSDSVEDDARLVRRFAAEAALAASLSRRSRHIVAVTDHGDHDGTPYLVMELLEGRSLEEQIIHGVPTRLELAKKGVAARARRLSVE